MTEQKKTVPTHELLRVLARELRNAKRTEWRLCGADYVRGLERAITIIKELAASRRRNQ